MDLVEPAYRPHRSLLYQSGSLLLGSFRAYRSRTVLILPFFVLLWIIVGFGENALTHEPLLPSLVSTALSLLILPVVIGIYTMVSAAAYAGRRQRFRDVLEVLRPRLPGLYGLLGLYGLMECLIVIGLSLVSLLLLGIGSMVEMILRPCVEFDYVRMVCLSPSRASGFDFATGTIDPLWLSLIILWPTPVLTLSVMALPNWLMCIPVLILDQPTGLRATLARSAELLHGRRRVLIVASGLAALIAVGIPSVLYVAAYYAVWLGYRDTTWWVGLSGILSFALLWPLPIFVATKLHSSLTGGSGW